MSEFSLPTLDEVTTLTGDLWNGATDWVIGALDRGANWVSQNLLGEQMRARMHEFYLGSMAEAPVLSWVAGIGLAIVALLIVRLLFFRTKNAASASLKVATRLPRFYGYFAIAALVVSLGVWSSVAPLASAALAPGIVSPEGSRKTVEHLEGGIIRTIHVREGDKVTVGQPLLTLEDVQAKAQFTQLRKRYAHLLAMEVRLIAERLGKADLVFPEELTRAEDGEAENAIAAQQALFNSHRATRQGRTRIMQKRILQLEEQNSGLSEVLAAEQRQIGFIEEEIASVQKLLDDGLERRPRLLALQRKQAELEASQAANRARISENDQKVGETEIQILTMREQEMEDANNELADVQRQLAELRTQLPSREDVLIRTVVRAPTAGTVMNIRPTTESGVINSGEPILEIVPDETILVIDAKVRPSDIDRIHNGMQARVVLTAYKQRNLPLIHGTLRSVSADRLVEERTGEPYFLAKIDVSEGDLKRLDSVRLLAGMPAEVMLLDKEQTFLEYLLSPLSQSLNRSFRED
jgi:HlyD family type I secretion membrane fusion protein